MEIGMNELSFGSALTRLWPHGDRKVPGLRAGIIAAAPAVFARYGITTPLLVAHVMAQISHECGAGHDVVESLDYSAGRMMQVWPSRFPTMASAAPYAHNPRALANKVYNGRMGNRAGSDDGWNFRGRGGAQTTGREGYERVRKQTGVDVVSQPDLLINPTTFLTCAVSDFINCGCLPFAVKDDVVGVTRRLNGGTVGLSQRKAWLAKWKAALGDAPVVLKTSPPLAPRAPQTPANAADGTIRKEFALSIGENSVHGSDAPETAKEEISFFFSALELPAGVFVPAQRIWDFVREPLSGLRGRGGGQGARSGYDAAMAHLEARRLQGFAGPRHPAAIGDQIDHIAADHGDTRPFGGRHQLCPSISSIIAAVSVAAMIELIEGHN
eukprot:gene39535-53459_t